MQWLNRLDDVLDKAFLSRVQEESDEEGEESQSLSSSEESARTSGADEAKPERQNLLDEVDETTNRDGFSQRRPILLPESLVSATKGTLKQSNFTPGRPVPGRASMRTISTRKRKGIATTTEKNEQHPQVALATVRIEEDNNNAFKGQQEVQRPSLLSAIADTERKEISNSRSKHSLLAAVANAEMKETSNPPRKQSLLAAIANAEKKETSSPPRKQSLLAAIANAEKKETLNPVSKQSLLTAISDSEKKDILEVFSTKTVELPNETNDNANSGSTRQATNTQSTMLVTSMEKETVSIGHDLPSESPPPRKKSPSTPPSTTATANDFQPIEIDKVQSQASVTGELEQDVNEKLQSKELESRIYKSDDSCNSNAELSDSESLPDETVGQPIDLGQVQSQTSVTGELEQDVNEILRSEEDESRIYTSDDNSNAELSDSESIPDETVSVPTDFDQALFQTSVTGEVDEDVNEKLQSEEDESRIYKSDDSCNSNAEPSDSESLPDETVGQPIDLDQAQSQTSVTGEVDEDVNERLRSEKVASRIYTSDDSCNSDVELSRPVIHLSSPLAQNHIANVGGQAEVDFTRNIKVQGTEHDSEPTASDPGSFTGSHSPSDGVDTTFSSSPTNMESLPQLVEFKTGFEINALRSSWIAAESPPWKSNMNCYGVVHVQLLRAQRLPCSIGSTVHAVMSLRPWKGELRTKSVRSISGPLNNNGVCAQWDEDEAVSMVHDYSSDESPVPSLHIELRFTPLGVFDFTICSLDISCKELMRSPFVPKRQWFAAISHERAGEIEVTSDDHIPMLQVEAMFEPEKSSQAMEPTPIESFNLKREDQLDPSPLDAAPLPLSGTKSPTVAVSIYEDRSQVDLPPSLPSLRRSSSNLDSSKAHLLRLITYWTPATCCVCGRSITSALRKNQSFHCEECNVDCCSDCRLQVDIQLPCGSDLASKAVKKSIQSKLTINNILGVVAPVERSFNEKLEKERGDPSYQRKHSLAAVDSENGERGIGKMKMVFVRAHLLKDALPIETNLQDGVDEKGENFRPGDYYVRVSWTGSQKTTRTRTILQSTGHPTFDSGEMLFNVLHYGVEFRVDVVDAASDKPIGMTLITTQALLQHQREFLLRQSKIPFFSFTCDPTGFAGKLPLVLELRTGLKNADFFKAVKGSQPSPESETHLGGVVGSIELLAGIEESFDYLYGKVPYRCPERPYDSEFDISMFQVHLARISALVDDLKKGFKLYQYAVSWKNPVLTGLLMIVFILLCFQYDPIYIGNIPVFFVMLFLLVKAFLRGDDSLKGRFIRKEVNKYREARVSVNYALHRPIGRLWVSVLRGKNLRSPETGLFGKVGCQIYWEPTRYLSVEKKKDATELDKAASATHDIGSTNDIYAINPTWDRMVESAGAKRLHQLLPTRGDFFEPADDVKDGGIEFPVLQPFRSIGEDLHALKPWESSTGAVVVQVKFLDALSLLPGSDYALGEVSVPFSSLVECGEISGWFRVLGVGTTRLLPGSTQQTDLDEMQPSSTTTGESPSQLEIEEYPEIYLQMRWTAPGEDEYNETEHEASIVIQEEMVKSALIENQQRLGVVGSSIGAFKTVRGLSGNLILVQNALGQILDFAEAFRNAFNFADPFKSSALLAAVVLMWLFLLVVPTHLIILVAGMAQFIITLIARIGRSIKSAKIIPSQEEPQLPHRESSPPPAMVWLMNAIRGLPTDEDLRKTYYWESRRLGCQEMESQAEEKRKARLRRLWKATWYSSVHMLRALDGSTLLSRDAVFAMIQGHRFLWWRSVRDFDNGEAPIGRIFLAGHAGIATPSPLEMRAMSDDEVPRVVIVFGRGTEGQEKHAILTPDISVKDSFERAVALSAASKSD